MARKTHLLNQSQEEVLVLTCEPLPRAWPRELVSSLKACAKRGCRVRILVEGASRQHSSGPLAELAAAGAELRPLSGRLRWLLGALPLLAELWILDRRELLAVNRRRRLLDLLGEQPSAPQAIELLMGAEMARGAAAYFDLRWKSATAPAAFSVRQKAFALLSGRHAETEFFDGLVAAREEVALCLPGSRVSKRVEAALRAALGNGVRVTIFANAESDDAPALRRMRRLWSAGAMVKICGRRLGSECAVIDGAALYLGGLPGSWKPWLPREQGPLFVVRDRQASNDLLATLESQVSVEMSGRPRASALQAPARTP